MTFYGPALVARFFFVTGKFSNSWYINLASLVILTRSRTWEHPDNPWNSHRLLSYFIGMFLNWNTCHVAKENVHKITCCGDFPLPCSMWGGKVLRFTPPTTLQRTEVQFVLTLRTVVSRTAMTYRQLHTKHASWSFRMCHRSLDGHCIINFPKDRW